MAQTAATAGTVQSRTEDRGAGMATGPGDMVWITRRAREVGYSVFSITNDIHARRVPVIEGCREMGRASINGRRFQSQTNVEDAPSGISLTQSTLPNEWRSWPKD